ncbi:hypothetical protein BJX96DRAFT_176992 [Aspergillus floccosus]
MLYLFANVNFKPGQYNNWQAAYDKLGEYVFANEPTTQTYYFGIPFDYAHDVEGTTHMFAFEAYDKRESLYTTHFNSPAMRQFLSDAWPAMSTGFDLQHYEAIGGNLDIQGDSRECGIMHDTLIVCKSPEARGRVVKRLTALADSLAGESANEGLYSYVGFECLDNETDCRILGRWHACEDMERTIRKSEVAEFWDAGKEEDIARIEQRGYIPNGKGWLHR